MFACIDDRLLMFAVGEQAPQWKYAAGGPIPRSPAIGPDGNVRVHSCDGYLHVVNPSGEQVFKPVAVGEPLGWASPLVDQQNNTWICRSEGGLIKVDSDGQTGDRPFFRTRRRFDCTGLIHDDVLYLGCENHYVHAIRLGGQRGENAWAGDTECGRTGCAINCALALTDTPQLLVASQDDHLHAFGLDGGELWATPMPGQMLGSPVVDHDGMVFVGISQNPRDRNARGMLVSVDRTSHQIKWQYQADAPVESTPVIGDDGILYFGDNDGTIHAIDLQGKLVWKAQFEAPVRSAGTIVAGGLVAFGLDNGSLVVLKCSSQQLRAKGWPKLLRTLGQAGLVVTR